MCNVYLTHVYVYVRETDNNLDNSYG